METLYDLCINVLKEYPDVKVFRYHGENLYPLNTRYRKANVEHAAKCCSIEGPFTFKVYDEEYEDYDGDDENGKPIILYRYYKVCDVYDR